MSTALVRQTAAAAVTVPDMSFSDMLSMGQELVRTGFLPDHIKNGAQAAAIILAGRELGMPPMRALRSLVLVKGKVTEYADSQLSRFKSDGGHATFTTLDETKAVLVLTHPNGDKHTESFSLADAKAAGLTSSGMYSKFPKAMLRSRVITAGLKSIGWEGGAGVYDPAELAPTPTGTDDGDATEDAVVEDAITDAQRALLTKITSSHVFTDRERTRCAGVQTKAQAQAAIDWASEEVKTRKAKEKAASVKTTVVTDDDIRAGHEAAKARNAMDDGAGAYDDDASAEMGAAA